MKKKYQQPATIVCSIYTENMLLAGSFGLYSTLGDDGVQLSRRATNFNDDEIDDEDYSGQNTSNVWE